MILRLARPRQESLRLDGSGNGAHPGGRGGQHDGVTGRFLPADVVALEGAAHCFSLALSSCFASARNVLHARMDGALLDAATNLEPERYKQMHERLAQEAAADVASEASAPEAEMRELAISWGEEARTSVDASSCECSQRQRSPICVLRGLATLTPSRHHPWPGRGL